MGPRGQEPNESTDDAVWKDLVARLEGTAQDPDRVAGPQAPHDDPADQRYAVYPDPGVDGTDSTPADDPTGASERVEAIFRNQPLTPRGPRDYVAPEQPEEDDDAGFTPADPPPLGTGDPLTVLAWIGAAGGPVLMLLFAMFWRTAPMAVWLGLLIVFLAGAGYLVTKLPRYRDSGDDGAEV